MSNERGNLGVVAQSNRLTTIDGWEINHTTHSGKACCDLHKFTEAFDVQRLHIADMIGQNWLLRFDTIDGFYHLGARCSGLSMPTLRRPNPLLEYFPNTLVLNFEFLHADYGPYCMCEAKAMARNGNELFFDLLRLDDINEKATSGDVRFTCAR